MVSVGIFNSTFLKLFTIVEHALTLTRGGVSFDQFEEEEEEGSSITSDVVEAEGEDGTNLRPPQVVCERSA